MNKKILSVIIVVVLLVAVATVLFLRGDEDTWICQNYEWVKRGNPESPKPNKPCYNEDKIRKVSLTTPRADELIRSPLIVQGIALGSWYFEGSFPVKLLGKNGNLLARDVAQAQGDWMTDGFVPFTATIKFEVPTTTEGFLVLEKDNPSGLPENDESVSLQVTLLPSLSGEKIKVKVFFNNNKLDPEVSCDKVFPVEREVVKTQAVAKAALTELLGGVLQTEKDEGFFSSMNSGVKINSLIIENGTAKVDFDEQLEFQVGGSCRVTAIRTQITETIKQFPTVDNVIISINGRTEDILQP